MADPRLFRLRVTFCKTGRLVLLSHLEVARALERTVRRAQLPFAVSQGYSPHMRIAFGAALPVGVGGAAEFFDLFLTSYIPPDKAFCALQAKCVEDLAVLACDYVENDAPAVSVAFPLSTYEAQFSYEIERLVIPEQITVQRKKKEKVLCPAEFLRSDIELEKDKATFTLEAKPTGSLRPDLFLRRCLDETIACGYAPCDIRTLVLNRIAQNPVS